jgi:hypothetical protein
MNSHAVMMDDIFTSSVHISIMHYCMIYLHRYYQYTLSLSLSCEEDWHYILLLLFFCDFIRHQVRHSFILMSKKGKMQEKKNAQKRGWGVGKAKLTPTQTNVVELWRKKNIVTDQFQIRTSKLSVTRLKIITALP